MSIEESASIDLPASWSFVLIQFLAETDSFAVRKEAALKKEAEDLRERLQDIIDKMDLDRFLETLLVADQRAHRPKVKPSDLDHPRFYWIFKNMDYDQWFAQDSGVLLLSGPTNCALDHVASHILGSMEEGCFGTDRIVLNFLSPGGATMGNKPIRSKRDSEATIFVHTLLHQFISSAAVSGESRISTASDFLYRLLDSIDNHELLAHFGGISGDDPSAVVKKVLDIAKRALFDALGNVLEGENDLRIVVNGLDKMRERGSDLSQMFLHSLDVWARTLRV
jgi:hypothetical protein